MVGAWPYRRTTVALANRLPLPRNLLQCAPHRRMKMSRMIMMKSMISRRVVMVRRRLGEASGAGVETAGIISPSSRVRQRPRRLVGSTGRRSPAGLDHADGTTKPALAQFETEQAVALERARQRQAAGLVGSEAEAGIIGRVAEQDHRGMATGFRRRQRVLHQRGADAEVAARQ